MWDVIYQYLGYWPVAVGSLCAVIAFIVAWQRNNAAKRKAIETKREEYELKTLAETVSGIGRSAHEDPGETEAYDANKNLGTLSPRLRESSLLSRRRLASSWAQHWVGRSRDSGPMFALRGFDSYRTPPSNAQRPSKNPPEGMKKIEVPNPPQEVDCSVFAPPAPAMGTQFLIQAYLHDRHQLVEAARNAHQLDKEANRLGFESLLLRLNKGQQVDFFLDCRCLVISEAFKSVEWKGEPTLAAFTAKVPSDLLADKITATLHVSTTGVALGAIEFTLRPSIQSHHMPSDFSTFVDQLPVIGQVPMPLGERADRYRSAFLSYSRKDFEYVSLFAEGLRENGMVLFMDVTSIEPGRNWRIEIEDAIPASDVFYLMWSKNAAESEMVQLECQVAHGSNISSKRPTIEPRPLHREAPNPPEYLSHLHFDTPWLTLREANKKPLFKIDDGTAQGES